MTGLQQVPHVGGAGAHGCEPWATCPSEDAAHGTFHGIDKHVVCKLLIFNNFILLFIIEWE